MSRSNARLLIALLVCVSALQAESLWPANGQVNRLSMFADKKAAAPGDIVTIVVNETANATSSQSKSASRDSSLEDSISQFIYAGLGKNAGQLPGSTAAGKSNFSGGGDVSNSQSLSARAAVVVTDVLPNGNLVLQGVRTLTFSGETQFVVLHGIVRIEDVSRENTVQSTNIAEARIEFHAEGSLTDAQKRGWLSKVYETVRPF